MAKNFKCADMGKDCGWTAKADSMSELTKKIFVHADSKHNVKQIPYNRKIKIASCIKDDQII